LSFWECIGLWTFGDVGRDLVALSLLSREQVFVALREGSEVWGLGCDSGLGADEDLREAKRDHARIGIGLAMVWKMEMFNKLKLWLFVLFDVGMKMYGSCNL